MSLSKQEKDILRSLAKETLKYALDHNGKMPGVSLADYPDSLAQKGASFVTLEKNGELRGCIGSLEARYPLVEDVARNTVAAAFSDPRFHPVQSSEFDDIQIAISVLSPAQAMSVNDQEDLLEQVRPGIDGLILQDGYNRATFLPSVWQHLPQKHLFLSHLKQKAGLPENYWSNSIKFWRYTTEYF